MPTTSRANAPRWPGRRTTTADAALARGVGALGKRYALNVEAVERLLAFGRLLATDPLAPTAVRDPVRIVQDHLADALVALELSPVSSARRLADIGAGAGVPGLPLAIALPEAAVILVESNGRKCDFLRRAIQVCGLDNASVEWARAESWRAGIGSCDVVTARALAPLAVVAEYAAPLLRAGGVLVGWRGERQPELESSAASAAQMLGLAVEEVLPVQPFPEARNRYLHVMSKVSATPARFPRRPGVAAKRPLGSPRGI